MAIYPGAVATDTDLYVAKDRSTSTLSGSINNSTLSVGVVAGAQFVAKQIITIDDEQMQIASIASNTLTIVSRGFGGTAAASHASGATVKGNVVALHHNALANEIKAIEANIGAAAVMSGTYSTFSGTAAGLPGRLFIQTDGPYMWRDTGSVWEPYIPGVGAVVLPPSAGWTWESQGSSTVDFTNGSMYIHFLQIGSFLRAYYRTATSTPYKVRAIFKHSFDGGLAGVTGGNDGYGLGFRDSGGKWIVYHLGMNGVNAFVINVSKWNSISSFSADYLTTSNVPDSVLTNGGMQIEDDGTNLILSLSIDLFHWEVIHTVSRTNFMGSGPNAVGVVCYAQASDVHLAALSWKVL